MASFELQDVEVTDSRMCARRFVHNGIVVFVVRVSDGTIPDDVFDKCMASVSRFVRHMKADPERYHLVIDVHRTLDFPMERIGAFNAYLQKKEKYLKPYIASATYLVQGQLTATLIETMFSMSGTWAPTKTITCHRMVNANDADHIPSSVQNDVFAFMDSAALQKGP